MRRFSRRYLAAGITPARFKELQGFCEQYRENQRTVRMARAGIVDRREGSGKWHRPDPTGDQALELACNPAAKRVKLIEDCAAAVAEPRVAEAIIRSVADGKTWEVLRPPIGQRQFYELRQAFYIELDRRLWEI